MEILTTSLINTITANIPTLNANYDVMNLRDPRPKTLWISNAKSAILTVDLKIGASGFILGMCPCDSVTWQLIVGGVTVASGALGLRVIKSLVNYFRRTPQISRQQLVKFPYQTKAATLVITLSSTMNNRGAITTWQPTTNKAIGRFTDGTNPVPFSFSLEDNNPCFGDLVQFAETGTALYQVIDLVGNGTAAGSVTLSGLSGVETNAVEMHVSAIYRAAQAGIFDAGLVKVFANLKTSDRKIADYGLFTQTENGLATYQTGNKTIKEQLSGTLRKTDFDMLEQFIISKGGHPFAIRTLSNMGLDNWSTHYCFLRNPSAKPFDSGFAWMDVSFDIEDQL